MKNNFLAKTLVTIIIVLAILQILAILQPGVDSARKNQTEYAPAYKYLLVDKHDQLLTGVAESIGREYQSANQLPQGQLQEIFEQKKRQLDLQELSLLAQQAGHRHRPIQAYMWLMGSNNKYIDGIPARSFAHLNGAYEKHREVISNDRFYHDRADFFTLLIADAGHLDFSSTEDTYGKPADWRFYDSERRSESEHKGIFLFQREVYTPDSQAVGKLYLKVDDSQNYHPMYADAGYEYRQNFARYIMIGNLLSVFCLWLLLPTWVYFDAVKRGVRSPVVWGVLIFFANILGLLVYLIARSSADGNSDCSVCRQPLSGEFDYCPHCGNPVGDRRCQVCRHKVQPGWTFCPACRAELGKSEPAIES